MSLAHVSYDWRVLSHDPDTGKTVYIKQDGPTVTVRTEMPVDDLVAENQAMQADRVNERWGELSSVARWPVHMWQRMAGDALAQDDQTYIKRLLNDPDYSKFRTRGGRI